MESAPRFQVDYSGSDSETDEEEDKLTGSQVDMSKSIMTKSVYGTPTKTAVAGNGQEGEEIVKGQDNGSSGEDDEGVNFEGDEGEEEDEGDEGDEGDKDQENEFDNLSESRLREGSAFLTGLSTFCYLM